MIEYPERIAKITVFLQSVDFFLYITGASKINEIVHTVLPRLPGQLPPVLFCTVPMCEILQDCGFCMVVGP